MLGGIHSFTIVDGAKVTPSDLGNNFLLTADGLGGSRAQCATGAWRCPVGGSLPPPAHLAPLFLYCTYPLVQQRTPAQRFVSAACPGTALPPQAAK